MARKQLKAKQCIQAWYSFKLYLDVWHRELWKLFSVSILKNTHYLIFVILPDVGFKGRLMQGKSSLRLSGQISCVKFTNSGNLVSSDTHLQPELFLVSSIRTPMLIQGRLERTETNLMHIKREQVTWTHGNQPNTFWMGPRVNSHIVYFSLYLSSSQPLSY